MTGRLDGELGWTLRVAYLREAFPDVYASERRLDERLVAVRELDDLMKKTSRIDYGVSRLESKLA